MLASTSVYFAFTLHIVFTQHGEQQLLSECVKSGSMHGNINRLQLAEKQNILIISTQENFIDFFLCAQTTSFIFVFP